MYAGTRTQNKSLHRPYGMQTAMSFNQQSIRKKKQSQNPHILENLKTVFKNLPVKNMVKIRKLSQLNNNEKAI